LSEPAVPAGRGGPQLIPRPDRVVLGPGAWWSQEGAVAPSVVPIERVRQAFRVAGPDIPRPEPTGPSTAGLDIGGLEEAGLDIGGPEEAGLDIGGPEEAGLDAGSGRLAEGGWPEVADSALDHGLPLTDPVPAAVLCALFEEDGDTWVVLTRRSSRLRSHTGEVAFPGGRLDATETLEAAALREAEEEVGIDPATVEVIGRLSPLSTMTSRAVITPFVGVLVGRPRLRPNPAEVDRAFGVALSELMAPGVYHEERWGLGDGADRGIHFFDLDGDTVWGATAKMLRDLLDRIYPPPQGLRGLT
jgi:8-oxo-dGTP pyrophosphatase MutT (NUDIX family)